MRAERPLPAEATPGYARLVTSPNPRASVAYYVAAGVLAVGLVIGLALFAILLSRDTSGARFQVGGPRATECPIGQTHAPACYAFDVTNVGPSAAKVVCLVVSETGTLASFLNGAPDTTATLASGETQQLYAKVDPVDGSPASAPSVRCEPA
jgi:hypothetical protein